MVKWGAVVQRMGAHLRARYPTQDFMFEVWNEPNGGFWTPPSGNGSAPATDAEKQAAYFDLYKSTADALKNASGGAYLVGGPATAGCPGWAAELVEFGEANNAAVDFISCHAYGGGRDEISSGNVEGIVGNLPAAQRGAAGRPVVLTEWSSSWKYTNLYHDDPASAAFIIASAAAMDGLLNVSSYWTFSDVFEEGSLLPVPFHGGFGLLTVGGTPKPSYRAFQLLHGTGTERHPVKSASSSDCLGDVGVLATTLSSAANASEARTMRVFVWNRT
jgi:xylan 1,4-beta-xylosidase